MINRCRKHKRKSNKNNMLTFNTKNKITTTHLRNGPHATGASALAVATAAGKHNE
jgi:hypothetical protein